MPKNRISLHFSSQKVWLFKKNAYLCTRKQEIMVP